jgi:hypothetical protein
MVGRSDEPDSEGNALLDLAEVLILADRQEEATGRPGEALERFKTKGDPLSGRRAIEQLSDRSFTPRAAVFDRSTPSPHARVRIPETVPGQVLWQSQENARPGKDGTIARCRALTVVAVLAVGGRHGRNRERSDAGLLGATRLAAHIAGLGAVRGQFQTAVVIDLVGEPGASLDRRDRRSIDMAHRERPRLRWFDATIWSGGDG